MDKKIEKKVWPAKRIGLIAGGIALAGFFVYSFVFAGTYSSLNVEREKLTISTVQKGAFQEFIQVTGIVQPMRTVYLDATEGGIVEEIFLESGAMVEKGDTILVMSNSSLRLSVMQQVSSIYDQINQTRNSRLNIEQNSLNLKERLAEATKQLKIAESEFRSRKKLYEKQLIAKQAFLRTKANYKYQQKRHGLIYESFKQDSIKVKQQLRQIDASLKRMRQNLEAVQNILSRLVVRAPISGRLSTSRLNPGQSISPGERLGQVDVLDSYKVRVRINQYYLWRITPGLRGTFTYRGKPYEMTIAKVYPVVEDGQFLVDMDFINEEPDGLTRGQSLRIRLELGDSSEALLVEQGGFYQSSGGNWIYKITGGGHRAIKQQIQLGRQNPDYFEVLSGLKPGDKVIISSYDSFGGSEVLNLE